jgi:acyl-coenzyme A synthetase/AMP-(fatty) acid ligase
VQHLGRTDSQIKLRGYRIELGDVEAAVRSAFAMNALACVVVDEGEQGQIALAYVAENDISDYSPLDAHLPAYMIPQRWMRLEEMPLNVNGKIDRKALRAMGWPA